MARVEGCALRRGLLIGAAGGVVVALATAGALWQLSRARCSALVGQVTCRVATAESVVALSFDDGPTPLGVAQVLPELERRGVNATFFLTGREAAERSDLVKAIVAAGHEVGNHSFSHQRMVLRPASFYDGEIARTQAVLQTAGAQVRAFRPPYGKKLICLPRAVERAGLRMIMWDVEDPATSDPAAYARDVVAAARPGSIILIHAMYPANQTAREALPAILDGLRDKGLKIVPVRELVALGGGT